MTFYLTFNQLHPLRDNWIEVESDSYHQARIKVFRAFGDKWAYLYSKEEFHPVSFPAGKAGITLKE